MIKSGSVNRNTVIILGLGILFIGGIIFASNFSGERPFVPKQFSDARIEAAQTAEGIVSISNESIANLQKISEADKAGKYADALNMALQEVGRNEEFGHLTDDLFNELILMTQSLSGIKPQSAAEIGIQAIGGEMQLAQKLADYKLSTSDLLNVIRSLYGGHAAAISKVNINEIITKMNADASAVNALNKEYKGLMDKFDSLTK